LAKALQQFKVGERQAPMMAKLLKTSTSEDCNNVVNYLSGLRLMRACAWVLRTKAMCTVSAS